MDSEIEAMFIKFTNYTKLRTDQSTLKHTVEIQNYFQEEKMVKKVNRVQFKMGQEQNNTLK